ncbi:hypothetical protein [Xinfangfangia pollutisoli]|uniref:hypothetical protein n=1 Tax=Xinfangfangia pollutisoli TaxID=2865960 RepID=UPI001CD28024|nr:hypothetical protein [Xinfangfangia pollutisoli]
MRFGGFVPALFLVLPVSAVAGSLPDCKDADGGSASYVDSFEGRYVSYTYSPATAGKKTEVAMFADCKSLKAIAADDRKARPVVAAIMFATAKTVRPLSLEAVQAEIDRNKLPSKRTTLPKATCVCKAEVIERNRFDG